VLKTLIAGVKCPILFGSRVCECKIYVLIWFLGNRQSFGSPVCCGDCNVGSIITDQTCALISRF